MSADADAERTRASWNLATRNHNAHKGDQAAALRAGVDVLFPEELELLGPLEGARLVHLQCNAGQDSLGLARRGARVTGVDFSDEAVAFARRLASEAGVPAEFVQADVLAYLADTDARFDLAFASYGAVGWLPDLDAWARGVARVLVPGGRLVYLEFHPLVWSFDAAGEVKADDYFDRGPYRAPVADYVAASGAALASGRGATVENDIPATSYQYGLGEVLDAVARAGLTIERVREYPYANGCRVNPHLVEAEGRRWVWPEGRPRTPLMFGLAARR